LNKLKSKRKCKVCDKNGNTYYYYSYTLTLLLKLVPWEGVYLCPPCFTELDTKWRKQNDPDNIASDDSDLDSIDSISILDTLLPEVT